MSEQTYSVSHEACIWADQEGWSVGVRDDRDGLDLAEIFYKETHAEKEIILPWAVAEMLAREILSAVERRS